MSDDLRGEAIMSKLTIGEEADGETAAAGKTAAGDEAAADGESPRPAVDEQHVLRLRAGHGANCSSIGSVIDTLFATATVGAAVFAGIVAALRKEEIRVVGNQGAASVAGGPTTSSAAGRGDARAADETPEAKERR